MTGSPGSGGSALATGIMRATDAPAVLGLGAWLKNVACLLADGEPTMSATHGDLGDPEACDALAESAEALLRAARPAVSAIAHDLHPDFFSTRLAHRLADRLDVPAIGVQHHHAHIAAVIAEHRIDRPVIGLALDGFGLGTDGQAWGGELLWVDDHRWRRLGHLWPLGLPGGDAAAREPWRMAASVLHALGRGAEIESRFADAIPSGAARTMRALLDSGLNCPSTTSAGRWFDAVAGALGLCPRPSHEAEAAITLETRARRALGEGGVAPNPDPATRITFDERQRLDPRAWVAALFDQAGDEQSIDRAALGFHHALADALASWATAAADRLGVDTLCLGGGCFLNRVLTDRLSEALAGRGLRVRRPERYACGDAGLALGQAWAVSRRLRARAPCDRGIVDEEHC